MSEPYRRRAAALLVVATVVLAACGSSGDRDAASTTSQSPSESASHDFESGAAEECYRILSEGHTVDDCQPGEAGPVNVPDVVGMRVCDALPVLVDAGLVPYATPSTEITWRVTGQRPEPGSQVRRGANASLTLEPSDPRSPLSETCSAAVAIPDDPPPTVAGNSTTVADAHI